MNASLAFTGKLRVYFNRLGAAPMMRCVSPEFKGPDGLWEIAVRSVAIGPGVQSETIWRPKETPDDEDGRPSGWIAAEGRLSVFPDGTARID